MILATFLHELLCVDGTGTLSVVHLTIEDDDPNMTTQEAGVTYTLDGTVLAAAPVVSYGTLELTRLDGISFGPIVMSFTEGGNSYYMLSDGLPADVVASTGSFTAFGTVGGIAYTGYGFIEADLLSPFQGQAFLRSATGSGPITDVGLSDITVYDDDDIIETTGETGVPAQGHVGYHGQEGVFGASAADPNSGLGPTAIRLVRVDYSGTSGSGSFEAIEFTFTRFGTDYYAYIPRTGAVDLADVTTITTVTALAGSLDGTSYADFGLGFGRHVTQGANSADVMRGDWLHNEFKGMGGADSLLGGIGLDKLLGGAGGDHLFGGMHDDTLDGAGGADRLYGGAQADSLVGGDGADSLYGGWDNDILEGGKKDDLLQGAEGDDALTGGGSNDRLQGGIGLDTLNGGDGADVLEGGNGADQITDGNGADTATGGGGADTFLFAADGGIDRITDFQNGSDLIDLGVAFASLVITTVAAGEVQVSYSGDTLILFDTAGTLTAADLTAADFL